MHRSVSQNYSLCLLANIFPIDSIFHTFIRIQGFFSWRRPRLRLLGENVPSVDVIVTVCNENIDILRDTILGALNIDYPKHLSRVIVSDDGKSAKLEAWVLQQLTARQPNLFYTARVKQGAAGYKAGNLNHAMEFSKSLPGGTAECVAGLDVDMILEKSWLRTVAAYLMMDSKVGVVYPAQVRATFHCLSYFAASRMYSCARWDGISVWCENV
jgi:cellulose synthase/poly-beta-1,6-N-acetylglucosamine synthase-like glycosyltransferase